MGFIEILVGVILAIIGAEFLILYLGAFSFSFGIVMIIIAGILLAIAGALMIFGINKTHRG